ncbi:cytotoxic necrotizing factor Rho-activating domain-containing protein [Cedecea davisae]|uniref:cytotoxic necrotizing factor Rho-activating domain-containing protein n=1 Tax=Cedecea davisae TaxID=158484 RepID=UPI00242DC303|nr:cytotoxic necrotizing factor Rho-activating domain-containing protein [Cedecea davisae]
MSDREKMDMNISDCKGTSWKSVQNTDQSEAPPAAQNIDSEDELYYDAVDTISEPTLSALLTEAPEPNDNPINFLFGHIVDKMLFGISLRIISRTGGLEEFYGDLRSLAQSHEALSIRLRMLCEVLARYHDQVPDNYRPLLNNLNELARAGLSIYQLSASRLPTLFSELRQFAAQAEYLLSLRLIKELLPTPLLRQLSRLPAQMCKVADILLQAQLMPEGTSLNEWLLIIQQHDVLPKPLQQMLESYSQLRKELRSLTENGRELAILYPFSADSSLPEGINWILRILSDPRTSHYIAAYISSELLETFRLSAPLLRLIGDFPAEGTLAGQLNWAGQHISLPSVELKRLLAQQPVAEIVNDLRQKISSRIVNSTLLDALMILADPTPGFWDKSNNIISLFLRSFRFRGGVAYAMRKAVGSFSGGSLVVSTWDWYQQLPAGLSWQHTLERFITELQREIGSTPQLLRELLPDYILQGAEMLSALTELPVGQPWQNTMRWAIQQLGLSGINNWLCQRYIELCLIRGVYESLQQGDIIQREALLKDLAISLKEFFSLRPDSELAGLVDLLPYLPVLSNIHEKLKHMPATNSWLSWTTNLLALIEQEPHPALLALRSQLETQIANYISDTLTAAFDSLWSQLPEFSDPLRFPVADAAPSQQIQSQGDNLLVEEAEEDKVFLAQLFHIDDEYRRGDKSIWVEGDRSPGKEYSTAAGLSAGWLAALFMLWRAYNLPPPQQEIASATEMQTLQSLPDAPAESDLRSGAQQVPSTGGRKYIIPIALLSCMGATTAWVVRQQYGVEKKMTLQQIYRNMLIQAKQYQSRATRLAPVTNTERIKRDSQIKKATSPPEKNVNTQTEMITNRIMRYFNVWNIFQNSKLKNNIDTYIKESIILNEPSNDIDHFFMQIAIYILRKLNEYTVSFSHKTDLSGFDVYYFISSLIFIDKAAKRIYKSSPEFEPYKNISDASEYIFIYDFLVDNAVDTLKPKKNIDNEIINLSYDFFNSSALFGFEKSSSLQSEFLDEFPGLLTRYASGVYSSLVYSRLEELITSNPVSIGKDEDIATAKKNAFEFYRLHLKGLNTHSGDEARWDQVEDLLLSSRDKIIKLLHPVNHYDYMENARAIIQPMAANPEYSGNVEYRNNLLRYYNKWIKYNKDYLAIINDCKNAQDSTSDENIYISASAQAITNLLKERLDNIEALLKNYTSPTDFYQQYALHLMFTMQINKIMAFSQQWRKIQYYWKIMIEEVEVNAAINDLFTTPENDIAAFMLVLKKIVSKKLLSRIKQSQDLDDYVDFYNSVMLNDSVDTITLKEEINDFMKVGEYLVYQYIIIGPRKYKNTDFSPESFYSVNDNIIERLSIPYITGSALVRNFHPLSQIQRETSSASIQHSAFYRLYNNYIDSDAKDEARILATGFIYSAEGQLLSWRSVNTKIKSIHTFKYTQNIYVHDSRFGHFLQQEKYLGELMIIIINPIEKYIYTNLLGYSVLIHLDDVLANKFSAAPTINEIYNLIYKPLNIGEAALKTKLPYSGNMGHSSVIIGDKQSDISKQSTIVEIITQDFHEQLVNAANELKNKGVPSIFDDILSLIPFYSVLRRKIHDPEYHPGVSDMMWDILDVGSSTLFSAIKYSNAAYFMLRKFISNSLFSISIAEPSIQGARKYVKALQASLPLIKKELPKIETVIAEAVTFSATLLNPVEPFLVMGSKVKTLGEKTITQTPVRSQINRVKWEKMSTMLTKSNWQLPGRSNKAFGEQFLDDFLYIDELTETQIIEAKSRLPKQLFMDNQLRLLTLKPEGQCSLAAEKVVTILKSRGYETKIIGCLAYINATDRTPINHYAVLAGREGTELVIDVTFDQFQSKLARSEKMLITSWEQWIKSISHSDKLKYKHIIIKEYDDLSAARSEITFPERCSYIESSYVKDSGFQIINMPRLFRRNLAQMYHHDNEDIRSLGLLSLFNSLDDELNHLTKKIKSLKHNLFNDERYNFDSQIRIQEKINFIKRDVRNLYQMKHLPKRISNYLYLNEKTFSSEHNKLLFSSPISAVLARYLCLPQAISTVDKTLIAYLEAIESVDTLGLAHIGTNSFLINDSILHKVYFINKSERSAYIRLQGRQLFIKFSDYQWTINDDSFIWKKKETNVITKTLLSGSNQPLMNKGVLVSQENTIISTPFNFIRQDKNINTPESMKYTIYDLSENLYGKIRAASGKHLFTKPHGGYSVGLVKLGDLDDYIEFIEVLHGDSGCIAIRISFDDLLESRPVILSSGELKGSTMIYAVDDKYLYAYHAGQQIGDTGWSVSQQGVQSIYDAHLTMKGTTLTSLTPNTLNNQDLYEILSDYENSSISYSGDIFRSTDKKIKIIPEKTSNVNAFSYHEYSHDTNQSSSGLAYAVISKKDGTINVSTHAEDRIIDKDGILTILSAKSVRLKGDEPTLSNTLFNTSLDTLSDLYTIFIATRIMAKSIKE